MEKTIVDTFKGYNNISSFAIKDNCFKELILYNFIKKTLYGFG